MKRAVLAFIVGALVWIIAVSLIDRLLRISIAGYAMAEPELRFTLAMMAARLIMAAVTSFIAGVAVGAVAPASKSAPLILGIVLLAFFIPSHISIWHSLPIWYHLTFLVTLAPLIALGAWSTSRTRMHRQHVQAHSQPLART